MQGCAQRVASGAADAENSDVEAAQNRISLCSQGHNATDGLACRLHSSRNRL